MRDKEAGLINNEVTRNRFVWYALGICIVLLILGASLIPLVVVQIYKSFLG